MGIVSPVGNRVTDAWANVTAGNSGIATIDTFDASNLTTRIAGMVKDFDITQHLPAKDARKMDPFIHYGIAATREALDDSGLEITAENRDRIGLAMGAGIGGIGTIEVNHSKAMAGGPRKISPFFIPGSIINMISGQLSIMYMQSPGRYSAR